MPQESAQASDPGAKSSPATDCVVTFMLDPPLAAALQKTAGSQLDVIVCQETGRLLQLLHERPIDLAIVDERGASSELRELLRVMTEAYSELPILVVFDGSAHMPPAALLELGLIWTIPSSTTADAFVAGVCGLLLANRRRRGVEREARTLKRWANAANRSTDELLHELRTPIAIVQGYCSNLLSGIDGALSETQRASLDRIHVASSLLLDHVGKFRQSMPEVPQEPTAAPAAARGGTRRRLRLGELCREVAALFERAAADKQVRLAVVDPGEMPLVWGDRSRLTQLLVNLLSNAIRIVPPQSSVWVELALTQGQAQASNREACRVTVRDNGPGIAPENLASIFSPGWSGEKSAGRAGLGLSICKEVAKEHRAELTVESTVGKGTAFHLVLPVDPRDRAVRILVVNDATKFEAMIDKLTEAGASAPTHAGTAVDATMLARAVLDGGAAVLCAAPGVRIVVSPGTQPALRVAVTPGAARSPAEEGPR